MKKSEIENLLPVRFPREACRICPACATWMAAHGTRKTGRPGCPLCHGDGRVPYLFLSPEQVSGRSLAAVETGPIPLLKPMFGECNEPGQHRAMKMGSKVRCPGCDDLCIMPEGINKGDLISTDLTKRRKDNDQFAREAIL